MFIDRVTYLKRSGQTDTPIYEIALMAEKQGGYYAAMENHGLPVKALMVWTIQ